MASSDDEVHHGSYLGDSQWEDDQSQEDVRDRVVKQAAVIRDMRAATKVARSNKDLESRVLVRAREEERALRRRAAWIGKEVMSFWEKAGRVVAHRRRTEMDARKKEIMDKQVGAELDFLLGQTQKYSSMLAERLGTEEGGDLGPAPRCASPAGQAVPREAKTSEYGADSDDADDEATLEEEEAAALAEGYSRQAEKEEIDGLAADADVPLGQLLAAYGVPVAEQRAAEMDLADLMARYGYVRPGSGEEWEQEGAAREQEAATRRDAEEGTGRRGTDAAGGAPPQLGAPATAGTQAVSVSGVDGAVPSSAPAPGHSALATEEEGEGPAGDQTMAGALAAMAQVQPTGHTLDTTHVVTQTPFLLKGTLREYQHIGLDWLVTLYQKRLNGILADEMGLGKTIQTISLLSHLACEKGDWGPHLVVVPTSVMLNWEMEFKKWCPAFKLLTYYGSVKERAAKRQGWSKPNAFHVCITSYTLVLQDARMFKRKKWKYLILDEAHMIKNWKSQRWQTLLNFNSKRRLLITGTPLQNDLMELWSLMHFLMPQVFASHAQFKDWFSNPLTGMVEGSAEMNRAIVERLHAVLRPFLLRRLKRDVEKQLPAKHEHVVYCRLSKRQRQLYEEYMASSGTRATLATGNFLGIINCLMQLRKVCNHPDLFEPRPIISAFDMVPGLEFRVPGLVACNLLSLDQSLRQGGPFDALRYGTALWAALATRAAAELAASCVIGACTESETRSRLLPTQALVSGSLACALGWEPSTAALQAVHAALGQLAARARAWRAGRLAAMGGLSALRAGAALPPVGVDAEALLRLERPEDVHRLDASRCRHLEVSEFLKEAILLPEARLARMEDLLLTFLCYIPKARAPAPTLVCSRPDPSSVVAAAAASRALAQTWYSRGEVLHLARTRTSLFFPDKRLIQFDSGKLQELAGLLARLKAGGHRALIFTQMSKMLDVLESFLSLQGHTYVRLDGATKPEQRQMLMQRFNTDPKIFCFILSTRSGGVGMNLVGADTVIFYDSDWNPAMDAQAQDRCHRIGQTREVHIYRMISQHTIEENILKKSDQKRQLDFLAIQSGGFTTEMLTKLDPATLIAETAMGLKVGDPASGHGVSVKEPSSDEVAAAMAAAEDEGDAAAATALAKETAAEMDEFTKSSAAAASSSSPEAATVDEAAAGTAEAVDEGPLAADWASALRPVERYAVRWLENEVQAQYTVAEFDIEGMEAAEEEREAEIDEDEEQTLVADWDTGMATEAYRAQVEAAQAEAREREEAEAAWIQRGKAGASRGGGGSSGEEDTALSPRGRARAGKRERRAAGASLPLVPPPWEVQEDLVLCLALQHLLSTGHGREESAAAWRLVAHALASGAAATTQAGVGTAVRQGRGRRPEDCAARFAGMAAAAQRGDDAVRRAAAALAEVLRAGWSVHGGEDADGRGPGGPIPWGDGLPPGDGAAAGSDTPARTVGPSQAAAAAVVVALSAARARQRASGARGLTAVGGALAGLLSGVIAGQQVSPAVKTEGAGDGGAGTADFPEPGQVESVLAAVRQRCGSGAARVIAGRVPLVVETARMEGCRAAREALEHAFSRPSSELSRGVASPRAGVAQAAAGPLSSRPRTSLRAGVAAAVAAATIPAPSVGPALAQPPGAYTAPRSGPAPAASRPGVQPPRVEAGRQTNASPTSGRLQGGVESHWHAGPGSPRQWGGAAAPEGGQAGAGGRPGASHPGAWPVLPDGRPPQQWARSSGPQPGPRPRPLAAPQPGPHPAFSMHPNAGHLLQGGPPAHHYPLGGAPPQASLQGFPTPQTLPGVRPPALSSLSPQQLGMLLAHMQAQQAQQARLAALHRAQQARPAPNPGQLPPGYLQWPTQQLQPAHAQHAVQGQQYAAGVGSGLAGEPRLATGAASGSETLGYTHVPNVGWHPPADPQLNNER
ncbi:Helicase swr1 [Auxenochlorella protothecoides]|uniref:Helicase swr1 n=1 Tax=Auxenochlorella protothecoides TaxID=3075 RepID=A0A087SMB5_AUXPR|nr:Helicase swr1 [Auxenochlorella protothecoides]KFM26869.1 Helicase swr1 [Auxenochlorella protothecoides]